MIWTPGKNYRWVHGQHVASVSLASPIWTPPALTAGVHSAQLPRFGRHTRNHTASVLHAYPVLDATCQIAWRPFLLLSLIWTPYAQSHGVQFCCSSQVGRHSTRTLASILLSFPNLDAIRTITRRPILLLFSSWTPPTQSHGVRSAQLTRFGRLSLSHMASIPHSFSNLDASSVNMWRPFCTPIPIWTPSTLPTGVHSPQLLQSGHLPHSPLASVLHSNPDLDTIQLGRWRPFCMPIMFWTPSTLPTGVHSPQLSQSGRLSFNHMASNSRAYRHLDAMLYLDDSSVNMWTPCYIRIHPPISPEFRKIKQATAWLSINLESGQLPSSL